MRRNQVSISVERFADQAPIGADHQTISVYADSNDLFEALAAACFRLMEEVQKDQSLPAFGRLEGHVISDNKVFSPHPTPRRRSVSPEEREARIRDWVEKNQELAEKARRPTFLSEFVSWAVFSDGKLEVGRPLYVGNKFMGTPLKYRYAGYQDGNFSYRATALDLNDVLDSLLYAPGKFSIDDYLEDYSSQEISLIQRLKEALLKPSDPA